MPVRVSKFAVSRSRGVEVSVPDDSQPAVLWPKGKTAAGPAINSVVQTSQGANTMTLRWEPMKLAELPSWCSVDAQGFIKVKDGVFTVSSFIMVDGTNLDSIGLNTGWSAYGQDFAPVVTTQNGYKRKTDINATVANPANEPDSEVAINIYPVTSGPGVVVDYAELIIVRIGDYI